MAITYFDCNASLGKRGTKLKIEPWKTEGVLKGMDNAGVSAALVYSGWSKDYAPQYGNERLMEELEKNSRFYGCYTIMPGVCGDFYSAEEMIRDLKAKKMVAAKMFPASHGYIADEITMGAYFKALEDENIPLLVDYQQIDLRDLREILKNHPKLNVLLLRTWWSNEHAIMPYLVEFPNLYVELSCFQSNVAIETLVNKIGAERILFGTGLPMMSAGAARAFVDYARISDAEKRLIAGENLARLCGIPLPAPIDVMDDEIAKRAAEGKPMECLVFDSHTHFLEDGGNCGGGTAMIEGDLAHMEALSDHMGVDAYVVAPWLGIWTDSEAGNEVAEYMRDRSDRVYPYLLIDPNYVDDVAAVAHKYHVEKKFPAMKMFYDRIRTRYNDPVFDPWWEIANENHLFGLMDPGSYPTYLQDVEELADKYPNVTFFLDHAAANYGRLVQYIEAAKRHKNIYLQLTYTTVTEGSIEYICKEGLADRALYGTDAPMRDPRPQLGWVAFADISVEDKKLILGGNMKRVADQCFKNLK